VELNDYIGEGDHVGVWPINSKTMIEKLAQRIGINDLSQSFTFEFSNVKEKKSKKNTKTIMKPVGFPIPSTFFETLERFLDITTPPSPQLLMLFANYTK
jgi:sulfite reductase alpha subunit-like flavoprotein